MNAGCVPLRPARRPTPSRLHVGGSDTGASNTHEQSLPWATHTEDRAVVVDVRDIPNRPSRLIQQAGEQHDIAIAVQEALAELAGDKQTTDHLALVIDGTGMEYS